jgi:heme oxygenase
MVLADNIILKGKVEQLSFSEFVVKKEEYEQSLKIAQDLTIDNASLDSELKSLVTLHENLRKIYEDTLRELDLHKQLNKYI